MINSVREILDRSRRELLDLSTRNRLLSIPIDSKNARIVQIRDELSDPTYRFLVRERKTLSFLPGSSGAAGRGSRSRSEAEAAEADDEEIGLPQPDDDEPVDESGVAGRHLDSRLQTALSPESLQRRLLGLQLDARMLIEEQGVNVLYLAVGHLKWFEADKPDVPRFAPLLLVPVDLSRRSASDRFRLAARDEEIQENLSLSAKLKADFGLALPAPEAETDDFLPSAYFDQVRNAIADAPAWAVLPDAMTLGLFSFAKFLMYRDLDAENWPETKPIVDHPILGRLLGASSLSAPNSDVPDAPPPHEPPAPVDDFEALDRAIPAERLDHVVDADGSQTVAIEVVRQGQDLVIQGPPGTGKSQTITNLIATAVLDGKRVLFVAEKLAALDVVRRRLDAAGLSPLCLELHSHRANKRKLLQELDKTWSLGRPRSRHDDPTLCVELEAARARLNTHVERLHEPHAPSGLSAYEVLGRLAVLDDPALLPASALGLVGDETWSSADIASRRRATLDLADRVERIGRPSAHPWRGVRRAKLLSFDLEPIGQRVAAWRSTLQELQEALHHLASELGVPAPARAAQATRLIDEGRQCASAPPLATRVLGSPRWAGDLTELETLTGAGGRLAAALTAEPSRRDLLTTGDSADLRDRLAAHRGSWLRWFRPAYWRARAEFRGVAPDVARRPFEAWLTWIDGVVERQQDARLVDQHQALGREAFGPCWLGLGSPWPELAAVVGWTRAWRAAGLDGSFRERFSRVAEPAHLATPTGAAEQALARFEREAREIVGVLELDPHEAFERDDLGAVELSTLGERATTWQGALQALLPWCQFRAQANEARQLGLSALVDPLESGAIAPSRFASAFDVATYSRLLRRLVSSSPYLADFDGERHDKAIEEFRRVDEQRLELAKIRALLAHYSQMPPRGSSIGAAGIVRSEIERKRGHLPIRRLLERAGSVVQSLKPVFLMSPLSVAQFLAPGAIEFDLLVIDEASQVQPVDALGAIARCRQIVVVGDSQQLPPTRFFARLTAESEPSDEGDDGAAPAEDIESILGLCRARGLRQARLRWHYRSRHHSLIAVSNREFYESSLYVVPSPHFPAAGLGLRFHRIRDGVFDSGRSRGNRVEARAVARAVLEHARTSRDSLGVAAFSLPQARAIVEELEILRRQNPEIEPFFSAHPDEPFFVKNLENVQGDERDVIFLSVGYGRDAEGTLAMRFGPLGQEGGERRLNVLISRARSRCEVFSSITAAEIDLARAPRRGVAALKTFLEFAETGKISGDPDLGREDHEAAVQAVAAALESRGFEVQTHVGLAGFFIDLAILDRDRHDRYLLGIELDGGSYRDARSARDRDRLRPTVLADHGWLLHRVWSLDWLQGKADQLARLDVAVERARLALSEVATEPTSRQRIQFDVKSDAIEGEDPAPRAQDVPSAPEPPSLSVPYQVAQLSGPIPLSPHDLPIQAVADLVARVVDVEGPVHVTEITARIRDHWGLGRAGSRVQENVTAAIQHLLADSTCKSAGDFLRFPDRPVAIRDREALPAASRRPEVLPPEEIRAAILAVVTLHHGAAPQEIPITVSRLFGFRSTSRQLRDLIESQARELLAEGSLELIHGLYRSPANPS